jgi:hypothetical protein
MAILDFVGGALQGIPQGIQNASNIQKVWQQQDEIAEREAGKPLRAKQAKLAEMQVDTNIAEEERLNQKFYPDKDPALQTIFKHLPPELLPLYKDEASKWNDLRTAKKGVEGWLKDTDVVARTVESLNKEKQQGFVLQYDNIMKQKAAALAAGDSRKAAELDSKGKAIHQTSLSMNEKAGQANILATVEALQKTVKKDSQQYKELEASKSDSEIAKLVIKKNIDDPGSPVNAYTRMWGLEEGIRKFREDQRKEAAARSHTGSSAKIKIPLGAQKLIEKSGIDWIAASDSELQRKIKKAQNRDKVVNYRLLLNSHQTKVLDEYREAYEKLLQAGGTPVQSEMEAKQYIADKYSAAASKNAVSTNGATTNAVAQKQPAQQQTIVVSNGKKFKQVPKKSAASKSNEQTYTGNNKTGATGIPLWYGNY